MSARNRHGVCIYCGKDRKLTVDHVPPKLLLSEPYPPNLLTVPACGDCNQSFMKDDEYTRTLVALDVRAANHPDVQAKLAAIIRSLQKPNAKGFAQYLAGQTGVTTLLGADGLPMGHEIDGDRTSVNATGERMVRAFHFIETGNRMPETAVARVEAKAGLNPRGNEFQEFIRAYMMFPDRRDRVIGKAFSYVAAFGSGCAVWMMLLYDYFFWLATVDWRFTEPIPD